MKTTLFSEEDWEKGREVRHAGGVVRVRAVHEGYAWTKSLAWGEKILPVSSLYHIDQPLDVTGNTEGLSDWTIGTHEGWRVLGPDEERPEDAEFFCGITWMKSNRVCSRCDRLTYRTKAPKPSKIELPFDQLVWVRNKDSNPYPWSVRSLHDFRDMRTAGFTHYRIGNGPWMEVPK